MADASWADWVTAVGTMLAGLAGVAAVVIGAVTARSWRAQARSAKEAEVAGEALVVALQYIGAVERMRHGYRTGPDMADAVHLRWEETALAEAALKGVTAKATAYLPDGGVKLLLDVFDHGATLHGEQWAFGLERDAGVEASVERFNEVFGTHRRDKLAALRRRAIDELKPLARVERA